MIDKLKFIADEFKTLQEADLQTAIDIASTQVTNSSLKTEQRELLIINLAAHILTISLKKKGTSGSVSNVKEGNLSITYSDFNAKDSYETTQHGRVYKDLMRLYLRHIPSVICV